MNNYRIILETLAGSHMYGTSLPYADFLLDIREGVYKYEDILKMSNDEKAKLDSIESSLPMKPDEDKLLEVYYSLYGMELEE